MTEYVIPITTSWTEGDFHPFDWQNYEINYESSTLTFGFSNWTEI